MSSSFLPGNEDPEVEVPIFDDNESLAGLVQKISNYLIQVIPLVPHTFDQMRTSLAGYPLRPLITSLSENAHNQKIICALMIAKYQFSNVSEDDWGLNESRGYACEYVAWQFLTYLSHREIIDFLLRELPSPRKNSSALAAAESGSAGFARSTGYCSPMIDERTPLLAGSSLNSRFVGRSGKETQASTNTPEDVCIFEQFSLFAGLNALEIATIAHAKKFLSQNVVQRIIDDIWNGEVIFWDTLSLHSTKEPKIFNRRNTDPYSRLRVPAYRKAFEAIFFVSFLALYYAVMVERDPNEISLLEALMYIWIAAFSYDELSGITDAGMAFYQMDSWRIWNMGIIGTGLAFVITREICSLVSLHGYFGTLTKSFLKFMPVVIVLYLGFLTTFTMLARDRLSLRQTSWILVKVFFGLVFICMTNMLLISSLVSLMTMSMEGVMSHAREEYLFQLSIYVLESSNSRRLTYFLPPLNLIPLFFLRPLRLFLSAGTSRRVRIVLLKITHFPFVVIILAYEASRRYASGSLQTNHYSAIPTLRGHPAAAQAPSLASGKERISAGYGPEARGSESVPAGRPARLAEAINEVERLRSQVERVAATLALQQRSQ
ncbi:hypothetical protein C8Q69DRAFT_489156 [Paecilomyces variotii]|uniref:Calcium channel YVC1-like C-terminal transmembrane domain-containing protein n=1 Tax=Byssochlamys spectabilis TaxID=264951 RepID=A0A443HI30_BYSSP|nr:hypothetical protein C8Q69DRAFT_489156 [Paecilomyces variotii]RWQ91416.1 hypothetical protein C8Q69DRAFT_489156 [Paecilomyces variotii]